MIESGGDAEPGLRLTSAATPRCRGGLELSSLAVISELPLLRSAAFMSFFFFSPPSHSLWSVFKAPCKTPCVCVHVFVRVYFDFALRTDPSVLW